MILAAISLLIFTGAVVAMCWIVFQVIHMERDESYPPEWADRDKWNESMNEYITHVGYTDEQMGREK